jgi:WD40 repeat protein
MPEPGWERFYAVHAAGVSHSAPGDLVAAAFNWRRDYVALLDRRSGHVRRRLPFDLGVLRCVQFDPAGGRLAAGGSGGFRVWATASGELLHERRLDRDVVQDLAWAPDGGSLVSGSSAGVLRSWDAGEWQLQWQHKVIGTAGVRFTPDGERLAVSCGRLVQLHDAATGAQVEQVVSSLGASWWLATSHRGHQLAGGRVDGTVLFWSLPEMTADGELEGNRSEIRALAYSPDDTRLAVGHTDGTVALWDVTRGELLWERQPVVERAVGVRFLAGGHRLLTIAGDGSVILWDCRSWQPLAATRTVAGVRQVVMSLTADERMAALASADGQQIQIVNPQRLSKLTELPVPAEGYTCFCLAPDGSRLAVADRTGRVSFWDIQRRVPVFQIRLESPATVMAFSGNGRSLVIGDRAGGLQVLHGSAP